MAEIDPADAQVAMGLVLKGVRFGVLAPFLSDDEKAAARDLAVKYSTAAMSPCPFCGKTDTMRAAGPSGAVTCDNCGAVGPQPAFASDTVVGWNTRATPG